MHNCRAGTDREGIDSFFIVISPEGLIIGWMLSHNATESQQNKATISG